ncbi:MAG: biotin--[acetyl-CoA-carboxylase] ligase [Lachnospiraceae bacterium]|nr:biotin--[acetyl-CoA-carboxylase] ligase [Lachnospiraceae bacterium]
MSTRDKLLELLESSSGEYLSGEEIAEKLNISRTSVWKAVNSLKKDGYDIRSLHNKGYSLDANADILSEYGIRKFLNGKNKGLDFDIREEVTSTNALLKKRGDNGEKADLVMIAVKQTEGRGRFGRSFFSPSGTGLYMSILLRPVNTTVAEATMYTTMAAVAAMKAVEELTGCRPSIKWVNDLYMDNRKVCGILTEASVNMENGCIDYAVLGIGFNLYPPSGGFPEDIENKAGSILKYSRADSRNKLAAFFLNEFMEYYRSGSRSSYIDEYRAGSMVIGERVNVIMPDSEREAYVLDVDEECRLVVRYDDGSEEKLSNGEVSIRRIEG